MTARCTCSSTLRLSLYVVPASTMNPIKQHVSKKYISIFFKKLACLLNPAWSFWLLGLQLPPCRPNLVRTTQGKTSRAVFFLIELWIR